MAIRNIDELNLLHTPSFEIAASYFLYVLFLLPIIFIAWGSLKIIELTIRHFSKADPHDVIKIILVLIAAIVWSLLLCISLFALISIVWEYRYLFLGFGKAIIHIRQFFLQHLNGKLYEIKKNIFIFLPFSVFCIGAVCAIIGYKKLLNNRHKLVSWYDSVLMRIQVFSLLWLCCSVVFSISLVCQYIYGKPVHNEQGSQLPNIFIIVIDALTANDMSLYGYSLKTTPRLDELSEKMTVYTNAQSIGNSTISFLPTVLTGNYPYSNIWHTYGDDNGGYSNGNTLCSILRNKGYFISWNGCFPPKLYHFNAQFDDNGVSNSYKKFFSAIRYVFMWPTPYDFSFKRSGPTGENFGESTMLQFSYMVSLIEKAQKRRQPVFSYIHVAGVHGVPYPSGKYLGTFLAREMGMNDRKSQIKLYGAYSPEKQKDVEKLQLRYDESIVNIDELLAGFVDSLKAINCWENSCVMITADHGQNFSSGFTAHGTPLMAYAEHHIPLIIKMPFQEKGERVQALVSAVDIAPTILDLLHCKNIANTLDGKTLCANRTVLDSLRAVYAVQHYNWGTGKPIDAVICNHYKMVNRQGTLLVFDLTKDPSEKDNLYKKGLYPSLESALVQFEQRKREITCGMSREKASSLVQYIHSVAAAN